MKRRNQVRNLRTTGRWKVQISQKTGKDMTGTLEIHKLKGTENMGKKGLKIQYRVRRMNPEEMINIKARAVLCL